MKTKPLFRLATLSFLFLYAFANAQDIVQKVMPDRNNSIEQQKKPYVVLISADGFRYDYIEKYGARNLLQLAKKGARAESVLPSFPSVTFPNHYTIVTGMYPAHHGLVGNNIYDAKTDSYYSVRNIKEVENPIWYGGTPIWTLAEQQGLLSACFCWPGSQAAIAGLLPSYYYDYTERMSITQRIQTVVDWLSLPEEKRPHIISIYLPEVDRAGHLFGPDSPETEKAVLFVDSAVQALNDAVGKTGLPVNFIFVSDHGIKAVNTEEFILPPVDTSLVRFAPNGTLINLHVKDKNNIDSIYQAIRKNAVHYAAYLKDEMPERYHYGAGNDRYNRIGDIVLMAEAPYVFSFDRPGPGNHGYDPDETPEMKATFIAWGPAIKQDLRIPAFRNVDIYPVLTRILGLSFRHKIDGKDGVAEKILNR